jgi:TolB-like protein
VRFLFADHVLDLGRRELRRGAELIAVEPQVFDLLVHLVRNRDRVIGKEEMIAAVWAGRIVSDSTLASRLNAARRAVADTGDEQRLIRTYARKGVRFVGDVQVDDAAMPRDTGEPPSHVRPATRGKTCIAVLPFVNQSGDAEQDYFSDGITEDIITELSRNRSLVVVARNSSFTFRGRAADVRRVGRELGADYVVEGSVRRLGPDVRISVQLSDTDGGRQLWAERYDRGLQDIFRVQDEITATIAARLAPEVGIAEQQRVGRKPVQALDAWDFFRLGTRSFYKPSPDANREAQRLFRRAIEQDPELAQAYGFLSYAIVLSMVYFDVEPDQTLLAEAVTIARKGVELDDRDAMVRFMYGRALLARGMYTDAVAELESAREMNPSLAVVHCGLGDSLAYAGRTSEAIPYFQTAIDLSPHDPLRWAFLSYRALAHIFAREFEDAEQWARKSTRVPNCHYWGFAHRVAALGYLQRPAELREALADLARVNPDFSQAIARRRLFYVKDAGQVSTYIDGLAKAGVSEC